jgi:LysM repeat protein
VRNGSIYVTTPNGSLQKYTQAKGQVSILNNNQPSDANDPSRTNSVSSAPSASSYKIQKGDTLGSIAKRYDTTVEAISKENKIADPNKIQAGSTLAITN